MAWDTRMLQTISHMSKMDTIVYPLHDNLYLNITNRCTLRCRFCPKFNKVWDVQSYNLRLSSEPETEELLEAIGDPSRYEQIVFCGLGEPTMNLGTLLAVASGVKSAGGYVRLNTDGLANLVYERDVISELAESVDEVSVSMNAQNSELYQYHCRPLLPNAYEHMLDFVAGARDRFSRVSVTALEGLDGVDIDECRQIAEALGVNYRNRILGVVG
jgi:TatD family-associated radical SAM protein